jgi:hypothetical protein
MGFFGAVFVATAASAAFSPRAAALLRQGAVYSLATLLDTGERISDAARGAVSEYDGQGEDKAQKQPSA